MRFKDKVALVTGSGSGIGKATVKAFAKEGAKVVVTDIAEERAKEVAEEIRNEGGEAISIKADVSKPEDAKMLVDETIKAYGKIDILVNNAGTVRDATIAKMTIDMWDTVINVCLKGAFLCSKFASTHMVNQKYGRIINISSRAHFGNPGQANYSAAKAGIIGLTKSLAMELGRHNVTVNAVAPGLIDTPLVRSHPKFDLIKELSEKNTPLRRIGQPEDVAAVILFLASDDASYVTGEVIHVSGGRFG